MLAFFLRLISDIERHTSTMLRRKEFSSSKAQAGILLLCVMASFTGTTLSPSFSANSTKAESNVYHASPTLATMFNRIDGQNYDAKMHAFSSFRLSAKNDEQAKLKCAYAFARLLQKGGSSDELKQAIPLYAEAAAYAPLWERSQFHIAECATTIGDENQVRDSLKSIIADTRDNKVKAQAEYQFGQSYLRANEEQEAIKKFQSTIKTAPESQFAFAARYYLGQSALQHKEYKEALKQWRDYLLKSLDGRFSRDICNAIASNSDFELTPADHKLLGDSYYVRSECSKALAEWKAAGETKNWFKQGSCLIRSGKNSEGKEFLTASIKANPADPDVVPSATLLARIGTRAEAIAIWKIVLEECPSFADVALYNLASRAQDDEQMEYYTELAQKYPKSEHALDAAWFLIWDKIKDGKYASALAQLKIDTPRFSETRSAPKFYFWIAKLEEKEKHLAEAKKSYEETANKFGNAYYAWRSRARLSALAGKSDPGWSTEFNTHLATYANSQSKEGWNWPVPPSLVSFQKIASVTNMTTACLAELHQWDECLEILPADKLPELRAACLAKLSNPHDAINIIARDLHGKPDASLKWQMAYPLLHAPIIKNEAQAKQVDPFLAHALIREESRYNVMAVSGSNALGLMQLMPATAMGVAKRLGVPIKSNDDIHKPENNLKFGIDYLSYTLGRFKGNAMLAVASYNGGPNAVLSWTKKFPQEDTDIFIENIPFGETREYVRKVFGSYWNYAAIYSKQTTAAQVPDPGSAGFQPALTTE